MIKLQEALAVQVEDAFLKGRLPEFNEVEGRY
jgi:hypothetical protein